MLSLKHLSFFTIFSLFGLSFYACNQSNTSDTDLVQVEPDTCDCKSLILDQKRNRFYLKVKKHPFNGYCQSVLPNGIVIEQRQLKEGKYDGDFITYYENGQIESIKHYEHHFINGDEKIYSKSGQLIKHTIYKQSTPIKVVEFHPEINVYD